MRLLVAIFCNACACGPSPNTVPLCDAPQWVLSAPGVLSLPGTGFTITYSAQTPDSLAVAGPGLTLNAGSVAEAEAKADQAIASMRGWGVTP